MSEKEFFNSLFPPPYQYINLKTVDIHIPQTLEYWDKPRTKEEGPVCECVGENTNKALFEYFIKLINQGIELPIYLNSKNQVHEYIVLHLLLLSLEFF